MLWDGYYNVKETIEMIDVKLLNMITVNVIIHLKWSIGIWFPWAICPFYNQTKKDKCVCLMLSFG